MIIKTTSSGVVYGEGDIYPIVPDAPLLINLCSTAREGLEDSYFGRIARLAGAFGFRTVSIDLPCHGSKILAGENEGLQGWSNRLSAGSDPVAEILLELKLIVDELEGRGLLKNRTTVISGTSRGGLLALLAAANDARFNYVIAFAPVTDLRYLKEFAELPAAKLPEAYNLHQQCDPLAMRKIYLNIGNSDDRVSTGSAINLTSGIIKSARAQGLSPRIELHVNAIDGHTTTVDAHDQAFAWLKNEMIKL
ncbi:MAG: prolyl oligopeptidase family serine peptidase [Lentisphaerota bacterium]